MRAIGHVARISVVLVVSGLALTPARAMAWGPVGHQVIANLAQSRLSPAARTGVAALLRGATLASVSNDADAYRNSHPETARWHYVNIPLMAASYDPDRDCRSTPEGDCILAAIDRFAVVLGDHSRPQADRATALRFLVHLIGDLHNPMHTTTRNDRGGNDTTVTFFGEPTNLHAVWDAGLMERTGLTIRAWTAALSRSGLTESGRGTPVEWALESARVAREHCYQLPASHALGRTYLDASLPVLRLQLFRAGVRLAEFLNAIFEATADD